MIVVPENSTLADMGAQETQQEMIVGTKMT